jgi:hypothetical protein
VTVVEKAAEAVGAHLYRYPDEISLQESLATVLVDAGLSVAREVPLDRRNRIDFLVQRPTGKIERVGVEVKTGGSVADVRRQLTRYARSPEIDGLVLVTNRVRHRELPPAIEGKPIRVVTVLEGAL